VADLPLHEYRVDPVFDLMGHVRMPQAVGHQLRRQLERVPAGGEALLDLAGPQPAAPLGQPQGRVTGEAVAGPDVSHVVSDRLHRPRHHRADRSSHGYDLKRDYDAYFGRGRPLPFGQVYATLARLARDGKAVAGEAERGAGPERKRYSITETGKSEVEGWLAEPIPAEPHLQTDLFVKVVLSLMLGRPAEDYFDAQRATHLHLMRELTELKQRGNLVDALLADHGPFHLEADLRWIDITSARLAPLAEENVALPLLLGGTHRDEALREARSWFKRLGLEGMERHRTGEMSGGQAQRVALARGLVAHPDVLFADEPTGSLDSLTGELVMGLMTGAAREEGTTVVLVTHEPRVAAYADREVIVRDGRVTTTAAVAG